jgi:hypothetical protein
VPAVFRTSVEEIWVKTSIFFVKGSIPPLKDEAASAITAARGGVVPEVESQ